jgi:hypothetical protein
MDSVSSTNSLPSASHDLVHFRISNDITRARIESTRVCHLAARVTNLLSEGPSTTGETRGESLVRCREPAEVARIIAESTIIKAMCENCTCGAPYLLLTAADGPPSEAEGGQRKRIIDFGLAGNWKK